MDTDYEAEMVLHLVPIAVPIFKDLKENDDFQRFLLNSLPVGYLECGSGI